MPKRKTGTDLSSLVKKYRGISVVNEIEGNLDKGEKTEVLLSSLKISDLYSEANYPEETLQDLKKSVDHYGFLVPLIVVRGKDAKREILNGVKRYLVAKEKKRRSIPALVINRNEEKKHAYILASIEKEEKDPLILTHAIKVLRGKYGYSLDDLCLRRECSKAQVRNLIRRDSLPLWIKTLVHEGKLSYGKARILINLSVEEQKSLAREARQSSLSVRGRERRRRERLSKSRKRKITLSGKKVTIVFSSPEEAKKNYLKVLSSFSD